MKIAYLSTFYPYRGGIAQFNASLYRALEAQNQNVSAFTFSRQYPDILFPGETQFVTENDTTADRIPAQRILDTVNPLTYFSTVRAITRFQPDILLMKYWIPFLAPSLGHVAHRLKRRGCTTLAIIDNALPHERKPGDKLLSSLFLSQLSGAIAMSTHVERDIQLLKPNLPILHAPHPLYDHFGKKIGYDDARKILGIPPDKKVLLFFGFIRDYKGLDILLDALALLSNEYHVVIAGEAYGNPEKYYHQIQRLGLGERTHTHIRYIPDSETPVFFSAADVCVLPYRSATQSGIVGIAHHFEVPLIATDVGGLSDSINTAFGATGVIATQATPEHLAEGIRSFFSNGEHQEEFRRSIQQLKRAFSWEILAQSVMEFAKNVRNINRHDML